MYFGVYHSLVSPMLGSCSDMTADPPIKKERSPHSRGSTSSCCFRLIAARIEVGIARLRPVQADGGDSVRRVGQLTQLFEEVLRVILQLVECIPELLDGQLHAVCQTREVFHLLLSSNGLFQGLDMSCHCFAP